MKKVFLLSLGLLIGLTGFAQTKMAKKDLVKTKAVKETKAIGNDSYTLATAYAPQAQSVVTTRDYDPDYESVMWSYFDLQSNHMLSNRMYQLPTGEVGVIATMSHQSSQNPGDRGTGYNFFDGEEWGPLPEQRVESVRTGWPTIALWGETGEIRIAHAPIQCWTREVAGVGEWQENGALPPYPDGFEYTAEDAAWPRVATSGDNHNIVHIVADIQVSITSDSVVHYQVYYRSENPTDANSWTCVYSPLAETGEHIGIYSADDYAIAANGHTVAILYTGTWNYHVLMYKSNDDGLTWERNVVWFNPNAYDWETDSASLFTGMFMPMNGSLVIDDYGTCHVALNAWELDHDELGNTATIYSGLAVDGVAYWNDGMGGPIESEDGDPKHALRLWWEKEDDTEHIYIHDDSTKWIGFVPRYSDVEWSNNQFYHGEDYWRRFGGTSACQALSVDQYGNLACAYSSPDMHRTDGTASNYYLRSIYVSYRNIDEGYWHQLEECLNSENFLLEESECIYSIAIPNAANSGEYWFGWNADDQIGLFIGNAASQSAASQNETFAIKVTAPEGYASVGETTIAQDVVYEIYPNPATDYVVVKSSMDANATITFTNLAGQTVKSFSQNLAVGENGINIDLESGVYFMTVNANGFNKTTKVVVK